MSPNTTPMEPTARVQKPARASDPWAGGVGDIGEAEVEEAAPSQSGKPPASGVVVGARPAEAVVAPGVSPAIKILRTRRSAGPNLNGRACTPNFRPVQSPAPKAGL